MKHFKLLAFAYWNNSVDKGLVSQRQINQALRKGLIEESPNNPNKYWITNKGLELFKTTESYKQINPNLNR